MELLGGIVLLLVLAFLFGAFEQRSNQSEAGKEMLADLKGPEKIVQEKGPNLLMYLVVIALVILVIAIAQAGGI